MADAGRLIAAIDQGTTSSRCMLFDQQAHIVAIAQKEHRQIYPKPGWVEHDPLEIWDNIRDCVHGALARAGASRHDIAAIGITNQRETCVIWDRITGEPIYNAIVWQDVRTQDVVAEMVDQPANSFVQDETGLPFSSYFSASKLAWILDNVAGARARAEQGQLAAGTMDSWLIWKLTGQHVTDITNAHRTQLMGLQTLGWSDALCEHFNIPNAGFLPEIKSSSEIYGEAEDTLWGVPVAAALGDQQAALVGQGCFAVGDAKCTYGTGNFLLANTGDKPVRSTQGLLTTIAYRFGNEAPAYALEGSVAVTGALVQWLRDKLGLMTSAAEVESLAQTVSDTGGVVIVPAFSGLFAPHWRSDARGIIAGLTGYVGKGHIARAALEAVACQTLELVTAMEADMATPMVGLRVDGGMTANSLLMQLQADLLDKPVMRPSIIETTCFGAAYAAGRAVGFWDKNLQPRDLVESEKQWLPARDAEWRAQVMKQWNKAIARSLNWA